MGPYSKDFLNIMKKSTYNFQFTFAGIWQRLHGPFLISLAGCFKFTVKRPVLSLKILAKYFTLISSTNIDNYEDG